MINVNSKTLTRIKDLAQSSFRNRPGFQGYSADEIRLMCLFDALNRYIVSQGGIPGFEVEEWVQEDCEPVEEGTNDQDQ